MKRPQGFDRPPAPRATARAQAAAPSAGDARTDARRSVDAASAGASSADAPVATASRPADRDRVATEPIPVVAGPTAGSPGDTIAPTSPAASDVVPIDLPTDSPADARASKRAIAAAARERRRYERQEVRRFTKRSRRRRITWAVVTGAVLALVAVIGVGAYSPLMALRDVRVEGAQRIPAADVQAAFAGVMGTPLPLIDSGDVQAALARFPLIETYVTETIPPGTLVVRIVERTPVGVIDTGSGLELVDAAGVVIDRPETVPAGQPLIEVDGGIADEGFRAVASVVRSLPAEVRGQLTRATAATADDVRLELGGGASVVWGSAEDSVLKADVLAGLMRAAPPDTVALYDVSAPTSPVTE
ncbi:cell division protein FtsQ [Agromyces sp. 3263]|uniref:FtsQ-type POTRA domain-containing protein n=1 Tax=Agromyces sp. 3263 TaxID=2817750 RepID=UPI002861534B|nr:FtsQ-type POTRA domain-containing protein [Agromyces sp. 3263]MDR6907044.1 cell division protein FtsQ [Agromyces sp. 3263]